MSQIFWITVVSNLLVTLLQMVNIWYPQSVGRPPQVRNDSPEAENLCETTNGHHRTSTSSSPISIITDFKESHSMFSFCQHHHQKKNPPVFLRHQLLRQCTGGDQCSRMKDALIGTIRPVARHISIHKFLQPHHHLQASRLCLTSRRHSKRHLL